MSIKLCDEEINAKLQKVFLGERFKKKLIKNK